MKFSLHPGRSRTAIELVVIRSSSTLRMSPSINARNGAVATSGNATPGSAGILPAKVVENQVLAGRMPALPGILLLQLLSPLSSFRKYGQS